MKKAILLYGGWKGHQPMEVAARFAKMLVSEGYAVDKTDSLKKFIGTDLAPYNLIVPLWTMAKDVPENNKAIAKIYKAVLDGAGLAGCHGGIIDAFRMSTDWQFMTGAQWVYHGDQRTYRVKYVEEDNLFTLGLKEFSVTGEQYYCHIDPACKVYAYSEYPNTDPVTEGNGQYRMPVILTKHFGKGKVFVFTVGHQDDEFNIPEASEIMRRGLLWAAGEEKILPRSIADVKKALTEDKTFAPVDKTNGRLKVAVIGCGNISGIYFTNLTKTFKNVEVIGCCDLIREKAEAAQKKYNLPRLYEKDEDACKDKDVDIILNITYPKAHYAVNKLALLNGKHVYVEKPLALSIEEGLELLELANSRGLYVGGAPDTFLGSGIQTAVKAIANGAIGRPVAGTAFMTCHGHESWHPAPEFYYELGGGPMLDMGPYYVTALVAMLGAIEKVTGFAEITYKERTITSKPKCGKTIAVETPTHIAGVLKFKNGAVVTIITSFDIYAANLPIIEIYGSEGTLTVPDPNAFSGAVTLNKFGKASFSPLPPFKKKFQSLPLVKGYTANSRGLGLSDMADAILNKRKARAGIALTSHVLEAMLGILESAKTGKEYVLETTCEKPELL